MTISCTKGSSPSCRLVGRPSIGSGRARSSRPRHGPKPAGPDLHLRTKRPRRALVAPAIADKPEIVVTPVTAAAIPPEAAAERPGPAGTEHRGSNAKLRRGASCAPRHQLPGGVPREWKLRLGDRGDRRPGRAHRRGLAAVLRRLRVVDTPCGEGRTATVRGGAHLE